ncbi:hypothetical protein ACR93J_25640, partial [Klebsiella pneumoniae]
KACVLPENPASYRVVRTKSYLFNKAPATNSAASGITRSVSEIFTISVHEVGIFLPDSRRVLLILQYMNNDILLVF